MEPIRNILIVDDYENTADFIEAYYMIFEKIKKKYDVPYTINLIWEKTINGAVQKLAQNQEVYHALVIDYEFPNDETGWHGVKLVKEIRKINKVCNVIFYTTKVGHEIRKDEFIDLINNNVFRFILKSGQSFSCKYPDISGSLENRLIVEAIIDAIDNSDPISNALEGFLLKYDPILKDVKVEVGENKYTIQQIIDSIRLDTGVGRDFVNNILKIAVFDCIDFMK